MMSLMLLSLKIAECRFRLRVFECLIVWKCCQEKQREGRFNCTHDGSGLCVVEE